MLLLNLNLYDIARMLDDLGYEGLMTAPDLSQNSLDQINKSTIHPELPEDAGTCAERLSIGLDHAECTVNGPEYEEDNEEVMGKPESLEVGALRFLNRHSDDGHQGGEHDVSCPSWTSCEVQRYEAFDAEIVLCRQLSEVVPMSYGVDPSEEYNGPCHHCGA